MKLLRRRWVVAVLVVVVAAGLAAGAFYTLGPRIREREAELPTKTEAPPDLAKLRDRFVAGLEALQRDDGPTAVRHFSSFDFGSRAVEQYRLYFLANGHQLAGNRVAARVALARLWSHQPTFVYTSDAGFNLASLYAGVADWSNAAATVSAVAARSDIPAVSAAARWQAIEWRLYQGDLSGLRIQSTVRGREAEFVVKRIGETHASTSVVIDSATVVSRVVALRRPEVGDLLGEELTIARSDRIYEDALAALVALA